MKLPCTSSVADEKGVLQKLIISVLPLGPTRKVLIFLVNLKNTSVFFSWRFISQAEVIISTRRSRGVRHARELEALSSLAANLSLCNLLISSWNLKRWCLQREENRRIRSKTLGVRTGTNNKLNSHVTTGLGVEPRPLGWEVSAFTLRLPCSLFAQGYLIVTG